MPPPQQQPSQDKQPVFDGQSDFRGGMDASQSPELIQPNQIATGVNVTVRGGYPQTRPKIMLRRLDFGGDTDAEDFWHSNLFQGYSYYNLNGFFPCLIASVGGHIYNLQPVGLGFTVTDITPFKADGTTLDVNSPWLFKSYFSVAATYLIIQDGQSFPFIYDGSTLRRSNPNVPEVPVGTIMAYGQGRLTVGDGNQFLVGDILGGATNVISFTETTYLNGGGSFILPQNMGNITAMVFQAQQDSDTGQGTLLVFGETGCISVNLAIPRDQWQTTQIVTVTLTDIGTLSDRTVTTINADVLFRSQDGIRSYRDARAEFGPYSVGNFGRTAMSYEVFDWLETDFQQWLTFSNAIVFDNRYLMTTLPIMRTFGVPVFQSLVAMDFIAVSALRYNQPPVFDGFWTGYDFYQLTQGNFFGGPRAFAAVRGVDNAGNQQLQIWELTKTSGHDNDTCPIPCSIESRSFIFGNLLTYKRMNFLRYWADQIQQRVDWVLRIRPDQYPGWKFWQKWTDDAKVQTCLNTECSLPNYQPQYRAGKNSILTTEELVSDGDSASTARTGFSFQIRLEWTGIARLTKLLFQAQPQDIPKIDALVPDPPASPLTAIFGPAQPTIVYYNDELGYVCPAGTIGTPVTIPAGTYSSLISVADANAQALAAAQSEAACVAVLAPVLTSDSVNIGNAVAFSYQIIGTNSPTSFNATGLPSGLSVDLATGLISGTATGMTVGHVYTIPIFATNAGGTGTGTLTITVSNFIQITPAVSTDPGGMFDFCQVSVNGGAYQNATLDQTYTSFQGKTIKFKTITKAGTYSAGNVGLLFKYHVFCDITETLNSSSTASVGGTYTPSGAPTTAVSNFSQSSGIINAFIPSGSFNESGNYSGLSYPGASGSDYNHEIASGFAGTFGVVTFESILNF